MPKDKSKKAEKAEKAAAGVGTLEAEDDLQPAAPGAEGDFWTPADQVGKLHLVKPIRTQVVETTMGANEAVIAHVVVLDEKGGEHEVFPDARIFGVGLRAQLADPLKRGTRLVGRLGKGVASPGKSAPYKFETPSTEEMGVARKFVQGGNPL